MRWYATSQVVRNLTGMDELDFNGWNKADWNGVFAQHHTDDVVVYGKGQPPTHGIQEHIDAAKPQSTGHLGPIPACLHEKVPSDLG